MKSVAEWSAGWAVTVAEARQAWAGVPPPRWYQDGYVDPFTSWYEGAVALATIQRFAQEMDRG